MLKSQTYRSQNTNRIILAQEMRQDIFIKSEHFVLLGIFFLSFVSRAYAELHISDQITMALFQVASN